MQKIQEANNSASERIIGPSLDWKKRIKKAAISNLPDT
jgi:hypothetical protein